ncbi:MAG: transglutaminase domain-containing protein [Erysipelotrichaceae bacterium]
MKKLFNHSYVYLLYMIAFISCLFMINDYQLIQMNLGIILPLSILFAVGCYLAIEYKENTLPIFKGKISLSFVIHLLCLFIVLIFSIPGIELIQTFIQNPALWANYDKFIILQHLIYLLLYLIIRVSFYFINQNMVELNFLFMLALIGLFLYFKRYNSLLIAIVFIVMIITLLSKRGTLDFPKIKKKVLIQIGVVAIIVSILLSVLIPPSIGYVDVFGNLSSMLLSPLISLIRNLPLNEEDKESLAEMIQKLKNASDPQNKNTGNDMNGKTGKPIDGKDAEKEGGTKPNAMKGKNGQSTPGMNNGQLGNNEVKLSKENRVILKVSSPNHPDRLKANSFSSYNSEQSSFSMGYTQGIENAINKINTMLPLSLSFENIFLRNNLNNAPSVTIENVGAQPYAYVPYGLIQMDQGTSMFQDLYYNFNSFASYQKYSLKNDITSDFTSSFAYPQAMNIYEQAVTQEYTQVPSNIAIQLKKFLLDHGIDYTSSNKTRLMQQIHEVYCNEFTYSTKPGPIPEGKDVILYFLLENKKGYCQHFAAAATLLFRVCDIPTRYTQGYIVDAFEGDNSVVKTNSAHAWCEIYQRSKGWIPIEVTVGGGPSALIGESSNKPPEIPDDYSKDKPESKDESLPENNPQPEAPKTPEEQKDQKKEQEKQEKKQEEKKKKEAKKKKKEKKKIKKKKVDASIQKETSLIEYLFMGFLVLLAAAGGIFYYLRFKKKKPEATLLSKTYDAYDLLQKHHFLNDEINSIMYRIRYSTHGVTENDYAVLIERIKELEIYISKNYKLIKKLKARYIDHLKV